MAGSSSKMDKLTRHNYDTWSVHMECLLTINDVWDIVKGIELCPDDTVENRESVAQWNKRDKAARARLLLAISAPELNQIKGLVTSMQIWNKLESIFADRTPVGKMTLL